MTPPRILLLTLISAPIITYAQATGLVPCSGADCEACDVLQLIQNLINAAITIATALAIIGLAWNGFQMVIKGGDNPMMHQVFRQKLKNIVIGFLLMLSAWVIVDTVMKLFLKEQQFGNWNKIECIAQPTIDPTKKIDLPQGSLPGGDDGTTSDSSSSTPPVVSNASSTVSGIVKNADGTYTLNGVDPAGAPYSCANCVNLRELGLSCKESQCYLQKSDAQQLVALNKTYPLRITEAMPPVVHHSNPCQRNGTCVDATVSSVTTADQAVVFSQVASRNGIRAVWEGESCATRDKIRAAGGTAYCKSDSGYGHITGTHYSLY